ncbi:MAG: hypothetical protein LAKADJCE_00413 [Candidatus Argoarchaeum ethanivorans]|uniref:Uncharacterized protein n=1 Tax=Candidatus Argoarchaeum ethanivorans TaxID=2608793 RepID=A0A811TE05_9EURY|nr:MAG: hypothetical protein LAKADJCE_00413 [Candidatus Argoarchaeum ethanivorans]
MHMQKQYKHDSELYNFVVQSCILSAYTELHTPRVAKHLILDYEVVECVSNQEEEI